MPTPRCMACRRMSDRMPERLLWAEGAWGTPTRVRSVTASLYGQALIAPHTAQLERACASTGEEVKPSGDISQAVVATLLFHPQPAAPPGIFEAFAEAVHPAYREAYQRQAWYRFVTSLCTAFAWRCISVPSLRPLTVSHRRRHLCSQQ